ncbi:unnamed protein product [Cuscuta campestris]|uniref:CCHC-type domain-containing protein n=1 Tax=Cuscuta campestris TaxID=132261 RepID=A0A484MJZ4_9ASTE|nr:unnamed protein product [Cuscuta campestris]
MDDSSDDDEVKLVMKKFCKLLRKKEKVEDGPVCYGCGEAGHIKNKCPKRRNARHFKRQRAYISWGGDSGDESTDQDDDETANLYLMAHEDQTDDVQEVCTISSDSYTFEEMQEALHELYDEFVSASKINKSLKKRLSTLENDFENLEKDNEKLKQENKFYGKRSADKPESSSNECESCKALEEQVTKLEVATFPSMGDFYHRWEGSLVFFSLSSSDPPIDGKFLTIAGTAVEIQKLWPLGTEFNAQQPYFLNSHGFIFLSLYIHIIPYILNIQLTPLFHSSSQLHSFHQSFVRNASIMAGGKSKSKASKKKTVAEASSSAPQPFPYLDGSFLEFGSEEELSRFITHFAKRRISPPRVLPELFPQQKGYHDLDDQLKESGLWPFVSKSHTSFNLAYVRAFYSNLRQDGDTIRSSINLYDLEFDLATFARVAGLPTRGDDIATYGGDDWILNNEAVVIQELGITNLVRHSGAPTIHSAPPEGRLLLYILTRILRPRDSSHTSLSNEDFKAVHAIIHGASINWAKYVMIHMADCASITTERSLPYAFLVMDLIVASDIHIAGPDTKMMKIWIIQDSTFRKNSGDETGAGPSRAPAPASAKASLQSIADTLNRLTIERIDWSLQRQHHDMRAYFRGINYVPPPFDSTFLGQNYEGEDEEDDSYAPSSSPDEADFEDAVDGDLMDVEDDEEDDDAEDEDAAA